MSKPKPSKKATGIQNASHTPGPWVAEYNSLPTAVLPGWQIKQDDDIRHPIAVVPEPIEMNTTEHLLTCLSEECVEVSKDISKALRFGLEDRNVLNPTGPTNRERIIEELNDLMGILDMLVDHGILPLGWESQTKMNAKKRKVGKFMDYAREHGALHDPSLLGDLSFLQDIVKKTESNQVAHNMDARRMLKDWLREMEAIASQQHAAV